MPTGGGHRGTRQKKRDTTGCEAVVRFAGRVQARQTHKGRGGGTRRFLPLELGLPARPGRQPWRITTNLQRTPYAVKYLLGEIGGRPIQQLRAILKKANPPIARATKQAAQFPRVVVMIDRKARFRGFRFSAYAAGSALGHDHLVVFSRSNPKPPDLLLLDHLLAVGLVVRPQLLRVGRAIRSIPLGDLFRVGRAIRSLFLEEFFPVGPIVRPAVRLLRRPALDTDGNLLSPVLVIPRSGAVSDTLAVVANHTRHFT